MSAKLINTKYRKDRVKVARKYGPIWDNTKTERNYAPGQHGANAQRKPSDYGTQLTAKQRIKVYYGKISEKCLRNVYKKAIAMKGDSSENIIGLLERRLSTIVYRLNFAKTIFSARQMVSHKKIKVNGQVVNISSYLVKPGDEIEVVSTYHENVMLIESVASSTTEVPSYLESEAKSFKGKFIRVPSFSDVPFPHQMDPKLVVEFYSR